MKPWRRGLAGWLLVVAGLVLGACSHGAPAPAAAPPAGSAPAVAAPAPAITPEHRATSGSVAFTPPPESAIPDNQFGAMVRAGQAIFEHTREHAGRYVGNGLSCSNCHLDAGRRAGSAPLWAAWVKYPAYRSKNGKVNTFAERLQGCFKFSMNGTPPPADSKVIVALSAYAYWLARGAPTGARLEGGGYPELPPPAEPPSYARGRAVYDDSCALCHAANGQGQKAAGVYVFPPLWGAESFNWGAGMGSVKTAAEFIRANMPFSRGGTLTAQQAWDVAYYVDGHERPQDPRFTGSVAVTRKRFHDSRWSLYGTVVNGHLLGRGTPSAAQR